MARRATFRAELKGARELEAALRELPRRIGKGAIRRALKKAAQPIADDAKGKVPVRTGLLQEKIQIGARLTRRQRRARGRVGDRNQVDVFIGIGLGGWHAHLVEFGTGPRVQKSTGRFVGQMPARPFMRPAWEAGKNRALDDFARLLWIEIEKSAARLAKRRAAGK